MQLREITRTRTRNKTKQNMLNKLKLSFPHICTTLKCAQCTSVNTVNKTQAPLGHHKTVKIIESFLNLLHNWTINTNISLFCKICWSNYCIQIISNYSVDSGSCKAWWELKIQLQQCNCNTTKTTDVSQLSLSKHGSAFISVTPANLQTKIWCIYRSTSDMF